MVDRDEQRRAALLEKARQALRELEQHLDKPGGSRVVGDVNAARDPESLSIRIEVPVDGQWVTLVRVDPRDLGMTEQEIADETRLVLYQSGVGIPDDVSGLEPRDGGR